MTIRIDYLNIFSNVLCQVMEETFTAHGIEAITEDEFDDIVAECRDKCYFQSIGEFRRKYGQSVVPRISREMRTWGP